MRPSNLLLGDSPSLLDCCEAREGLASLGSIVQQIRHPLSGRAMTEETGASRREPAKDRKLQTLRAAAPAQRWVFNKRSFDRALA